jgi:KaiC/GvpD/RAD55 family RecA-like ATPase
MLNETATAAAIVAAWSADVYVKREVKPAEALLGPLARGCITLLCGPRGTGKSWLALALAHAAARGGTLAAWRTRKKQRVVFIDAAGSEAVLHERLVALARGKAPPSLVVVPGDAQTGGLPDLSTEIGRKGFDELVTDADLVVIDGLSALVRKGRGVGQRWAALEDWLRSLRRRRCAVLLVDTSEPKALSDIADAVLRVDRPADGVQQGDLRLQVKLPSSRPCPDSGRFELRMSLRKDGAAWTHVDDIDHRAIMAYRLDRADYSSREIARMLNVSPATAWRLVTRGSRLPPHIRDGVDLEVPIPPRPQQKKRDWAKILRLAGLSDAAPESLLPREKGGPAPQARGDEGPAAPDISNDAGEIKARGESPSPSPLPRERVPERTTERRAPETQTPQSGEAVKRPEAAKTLDVVPTEELVTILLARRRDWNAGTPPPDRLAAFSYAELVSTARARLSARVLNRRILELTPSPASAPPAAPSSWRRAAAPRR